MEYEILEELVRHEQSVIYIIKDKETDEKLVLKQVSKGALFNLTELDAMQRITHPNIIKPLEFFYFFKTNPGYGIGAKNLNYVFPLAEGTLDDVLDKISYKKRLRYLRELTSALSFLHRNEIYHCDLKSANILIINDHAVLADLGVATYDSFHEIKICHEMKWTPPEVLLTLKDIWKSTYPRLIRKVEEYTGQETQKEVNPKLADIWAFGIIALALLLGRIPFENTKNPTQEYIDFLQRKDEIIEETEERFHFALKKCLEINPTKRSDSLEYFFEALGSEEIKGEIILNLSINKKDYIGKEREIEHGLSLISNFTKKLSFRASSYLFAVDLFMRSILAFEELEVQKIAIACLAIVSVSMNEDVEDIFYLFLPDFGGTRFELTFIVGRIVLWNKGIIFLPSFVKLALSRGFGRKEISYDEYFALKKLIE
jgi:Protein kinase domain.